MPRGNKALNMIYVLKMTLNRDLVFLVAGEVVGKMITASVHVPNEHLTVLQRE